MLSLSGFLLVLLLSLPRLWCAQEEQRAMHRTAQRVWGSRAIDFSSAKGTAALPEASCK